MSKAVNQLLAALALASLVTASVLAEPRKPMAIKPGKALGPFTIGMPWEKAKSVAESTSSDVLPLVVSTLRKGGDFAVNLKDWRLHVSFKNAKLDVIGAFGGPARTASGVGPGSTAAQVEKALGKPDASRTIDGGRSLDYNRKGAIFVLDPSDVVTIVWVTGPGQFGKVRAGSSGDDEAIDRALKDAVAEFEQVEKPKQTFVTRRFVEELIKKGYLKKLTTPQLQRLQCHMIQLDIANAIPGYNLDRNENRQVITPSFLNDLFKGGYLDYLPVDPGSSEAGSSNYLSTKEGRGVTCVVHGTFVPSK